MQKGFLFLFITFILIGNLYSQNITTKLVDNLSGYNADLVGQQIKVYDIIQVDLEEVPSLQTGKHGQIEALDMELSGGPFNTVLHLYNAGIIHPDYKRSTTTGTISDDPVASPMMGFTSEGLVTRMTINEGFLLGYIETDDTRYYVEPLKKYDENVADDYYVIYDMHEAIYQGEALCGVDEQSSIEDDNPILGQVESRGCYEVEYALASDYKMFQKYGSTTNVENHMIAVTNNMQTNYSDDFNEEIVYVIVETFIVNCSGCDPWTSSTNPSTFLNSFTNWARGSSGFSAHHDVASCWTNRNFNGGTVGIAWLNTLCRNNRYNCLQDFTSNSNLLRVMTAHELGHNWGCYHDASGSPYIMAPAVNNTNQWSTSSKNTINARIVTGIGGTCLEPCSSTEPPIADFSAEEREICVGESVQFHSESENAESYAWEFEGGSPATSSQKDPVITYNNSGNFKVTLTVTNSVGEDTKVRNNYITVHGDPIASFLSSVSGVIVEFINTSQHADTYHWDFGDGNTSQEENPVHVYESVGDFTVTLTVSGFCGTDTETKEITIDYPPTADFNASPREGCAPITVNFTSNSPYAETYLWTFEGGSPATSTDQDVMVTYYDGGDFNVTLEVTNISGYDVLFKENYISVKDKPIIDFTYSVNGLTVAFQNNTEWGNTYHWDFGDGATSNQENPTYTYADPGSYMVVLTATNECGESTYAREVELILHPIANFEADKTILCEGETVHFVNLSEYAETYDWEFDGGEPATSTGKNPSVQYNQEGVYTVTLTATNSSGDDVMVRVNYITVLPQPQAQFISSIDGKTVDFINMSENADSYHWDFGDGNTSQYENPTYTYSAGGDYTVTLTVTGECGDDTATQVIHIEDMPIADFTASANEGCRPLTVVFTSNSPNADTYFWTFEGGTPATSTQPNVTVTYNEVGSFDVSLKVTNSSGEHIKYESDYITVRDIPVAGFNASKNRLTVDFTNTSQNADTYHWDFGDGGTSTQVNPTHTYTQSGSYTVVLTAENNCGEDSYTFTVTVRDVPVADFTSDVTEGCAPLTVRFESNSSDADAYLWTFEGGSPGTSTQQNVTVIYENAGAFDVTLHVENTEGTDVVIKSDYIVVNDIPTAGFNANIDDLTVDFINTSENANSYLWDFGDGEESNQKNPTHTYENSGSYTVILTATNECGRNTYTRTMNVGDFPNAQFSVSNSSGCVPLEVTFESDYSGDISAYEWTFEGGNPTTSTEASPTVLYSATGSYDVQLIVENGLGRDTLLKRDYIIVGAPPISMFSYDLEDLTVQFTEEVEGDYTSLHWDFGDGETSSDENPSHTYVDYGQYQVVLVASNNCGSDTFTMDVIFTEPAAALFDVSQSEGCVPLTVQMLNYSTGDELNYLWTFEGGDPFTSTQRAPVVTYAEAGLYSASLIVYNDVSADTLIMDKLIEVFPLPIADFNFAVSGDTVSFTNLSQHADSYHWDFGDGGESIEMNPIYVYEDGVNGNTIILQAYNQCDTVSKIILLDNSLPPLAKVSAQSQKICVGTSLTFHDVSEGLITTREWIFQGGEPGRSDEQNPEIYYNETGRYDVMLIVSNSVGSDTVYERDYVTVIDVPIADFDYEMNGDTVQFIQKSTFASEYRWSFGNGEVQNGKEPTIVYSTGGEYIVELIARNKCGADTIRKQIFLTTAAPEISLSSFNVFPNPFNDRIHLQFSPEFNGKVEVIMYSVTGNVVLEKEYMLYSAAITESLDMSGISPGLYILRLHNEGKIAYRKLIKQ